MKTYAIKLGFTNKYLEALCNNYDNNDCTSIIEIEIN